MVGSRGRVRAYERRGLLAEPVLSLGGHRRDPAGAVDVVRAIKAAQRLGFALDEIAVLAHGVADVAAFGCTDHLPVWITIDESRLAG